MTHQPHFGKHVWRNWIRPIAIVVLVCYSFKSAVADWYDVPTGSMKPTILEGDRILVNKLAYDLKFPFTTWHLLTWSDPAPGEVVVCYSPADGTRLVKRVIAGPGDSIALRGNRLVINDQPIAYQQAAADWAADLSAADRAACVLACENLAGHAHAVMRCARLPAPRDFGPVTVPPDHFFMMGDNRDASLDSRMFGTVPRDQIIGRTGRIAFSLDRDRHFRPRFDRFLRRMDP